MSSAGTTYPVAGTKWSVAGFDHNGAIGGFHPTPWEFHEQAMHAGSFWAGGWAVDACLPNTINCEILVPGAVTVSDHFQICFVSCDRFIAIKDGKLYRFGMWLSGGMKGRTDSGVQPTRPD